MDNGNCARILRDATETIAQVTRVCEKLGGDDVSMHERQRQELCRFLKAHANYLKDACQRGQASAAEFDWQLLLDRRQELADALQFINSAFIAPRFLNVQQQYLEAADWMCVQGFQDFVCDEGGPIGPLVAIDSRRSPAVWSQDIDLPMPTLFQSQPNRVQRREKVKVDSRALAWFPVICLPENVSRQPEYYPLLAHEVGHAIDSLANISSAMVSELHGRYADYWQAWMREIVADTCGVMLAGRAFALALSNFIAFQRVETRNLPGSSYPGKALRMALVNSIVRRLAGNQAASEQLDEEAQRFLQEFEAELLEPLIDSCTPKVADYNWQQEDANVQQFAQDILSSHANHSNCSYPAQFPFRLLASSIALAQQTLSTEEQSRFDTLELFRELQATAPRPTWVGAPFRWQFVRSVLSSLRPTYLAADGRSKLPPVELMMQYDDLVFVGATNGNLCGKLDEAARQGAKWRSIKVLFASPELLGQVEYYETTEQGSVKADTQKAIDEQLEARTRIQAFLETQSGTQWQMLEFDGPPLFAAYYGASAPGGRIHISSQLLGTDIRQCPSSDFLWTENVPPYQYRAYQRHLERLIQQARVVADSSSGSRQTTLAPLNSPAPPTAPPVANLVVNSSDTLNVNYSSTSVPKILSSSSGKMLSPVSIYIVHHPDCKLAAELTGKLYQWFRLGYLSGDSSAAGLPVYYRRMQKDGSILPAIKYDDAEFNVVVVLTDENVVLDRGWRQAVVSLAERVDEERNKGRAVLLPVALHESFYRLSPVYALFNPIRAIGLVADKAESVVRRAITEATARHIRTEKNQSLGSLDIFLSHAKADGRLIAEGLRDGMRRFGQLVPWYDANDLPLGATWQSPMEKAAADGTAAMIATVTDAYPTRPWCRKELTLARTPRRCSIPDNSRVWRVQPVVAVHQPRSSWVRGVPMIDGVVRVGWDESQAERCIELVVDRLVLEILLCNVHRKLAEGLDATARQRASAIQSLQETCYITWVPDSWTLAALRHEMGEQANQIRRICYPGYGLSIAERSEIRPVISAFHPQTTLITFEEAMAHG